MIRFWRKLASNIKIFLLAIFVGLIAIPASHAHEVRPMIVDFTASENGAYTLSMKFNLEAFLANIGIEHADTADDPNAVRYDELRKLEAAKIEALLKEKFSDFSSTVHLRFDGERENISFTKIVIPPVGDVDLARDSVAVFSGKIPSVTKKLSWQLDKKMGASVFRFTDKADNATQDEAIATYVGAGEISKEIAVTGPVIISAVATFMEYIAVGFDHIVPKGLDHILFVVGLFLLSTRLSPLLWQITSFTVAHTVTLALGMLGVISMPANIVEPLIAASIVYVAVENIFMSSLSPWRPALVFLFGLLHGLGFAGVLREFGLSSGNFISGLIGFNVGVELGQLSVIAACFLVVGFWFGNKNWYRKVIVIPGSLIIAAIGSYWFYERVFLA